jgi:hypothetical protein
MFKKFVQATFRENSQLGCVILLLCTLALIALFVFSGFYFGWLST